MSAQRVVLILHEVLGAGGWISGICILAGTLISESGIGEAAAQAVQTVPEAPAIQGSPAAQETGSSPGRSDMERL